MEKVLSNAEMRRADEYTVNKLNISSEILMRRAGIAIALEVEKHSRGKSVTVVCGTGNNGGDGYVCAQKLEDDGFNVRVFAADGNLSADCLREKSAYKGEYCGFISGDVIVDCLFGTGLSRELDGENLKTVNRINDSGAYVISADIPSGVNGDNGLIMGAGVRADETVAIAEYKLGHFLNDGADCSGKLIKADIGITCPPRDYAQIFCDGDIKKFYPERLRNTHKGTYGTAQLVVGSDKYMGAAALAAEAALKSGCGYVKVCSCEKVKLALAARLPQAIFSDEIDLSAQCIALGCGTGVSEDVYKTLKSLLNGYRGTLIIDADGINSLAAYGRDILLNKSCNVVLTPHVKEFSRLSGLDVGTVLQNPVKAARDFASEYKVTVLLKSAASVITDGERTAVLNRGNSALSKGGSGDMLTGFACGAAARGTEGFFAAATASYTIGLCAEICSAEKTEYCVTAADIIKNLHKAVLKLTK